jgi:hypothetical protein
MTPGFSLALLVEDSHLAGIPINRYTLPAMLLVFFNLLTSLLIVFFFDESIGPDGKYIN